MKKLLAVLLMIFLCCFSFATAEEYSGLGEEDCCYYAPEYGLALLDMPEIYWESPYFIIPGVMAVNEELKAAAVYTELIVPLSEPDEDGSSIDYDMLFGMALVGMEGDLSAEDAAKFAEEYGLDFSAFTEEKRADDRNIFVDASYWLDPADNCTEELKEIILSYQAALPEMYSYFVNIPHSVIAEAFTFNCADFTGNSMPAKELFARAKYTLLEVVTSYYSDVCVPQAAELQAACDSLGSDRLQLVLICADAEKAGDEYADALQKEMEKEKLSNTCLLYTQEIAEQLPVTGYPTICLADYDGNVIATYPGGTDNCEGYLGWLSELGIY